MPSIDPAAARAAQLARRYSPKGELELLFIRQIASAELTFNSLQRAIAALLASSNLDERAEIRVERLTRAQARAQRMLATALKELKALQLLRLNAEASRQVRSRPASRELPDLLPPLPSSHPPPLLRTPPRPAPPRRQEPLGTPLPLGQSPAPSLRTNLNTGAQ